LSFIDDSGSGGDAQYYVLAGYSATESTWRALWADWRATLDVSPKLEYFKMSEAESRKGQFLGFSPEQRTQRINQFIDVILAHSLQEASVAIPEKSYREVLYPILHKYHANPYYIAFIAMVSAHAGINRHSGSREITDFIFDQQDGMQNKALRLYHLTKLALPDRQLGRVGYRSDKDTLPLQAADLIAWQIRRFLCTSGEPRRDELRRLHSGRVPPFRSILREKDLQKLVTAVQDNIPKLREEHGNEKVDRFLGGIDKRNRREGVMPRALAS
jgi:hypothetical protein